MTRRTPAQYDWEKLEFDETLMTKHFNKVSGKRDIKLVVVHHMVITSPNALDKCYQVWQTRRSSAHYGVEDGQVRQYVWDNNRAWANGDNWANDHAISIEHANSGDEPDYLLSEGTLATSARLCAHLHKAYRLGRPRLGVTVRPHSDFFATGCPGPFFKARLASYVAEAQRVYDQTTGVTPTQPTPGGDMTTLTQADLDNLARRFWEHIIPDPYQGGDAQMTTGTALMWTRWDARKGADVLGATGSAGPGAPAETVRQIVREEVAAASGVTPDVIREGIKAAVSDVLKELLDTIAPEQGDK